MLVNLNIWKQLFFELCHCHCLFCSGFLRQRRQAFVSTSQNAARATMQTHGRKYLSYIYWRKKNFCFAKAWVFDIVTTGQFCTLAMFLLWDEQIVKFYEGKHQTVKTKKKNIDISFVQLSSVVDLAKLVNSQYIVLSYYTLVLQKCNQCTMSNWSNVE